MRNKYPLHEADASVLVLQGPETILEQTELLEQFAVLCDQPYAFRWLRYVLRHGWRWQRPSLVLVFKPGPRSRTLHSSQLAGAALFIEYVWLGARSCAMVSREVVAPRLQRAQVAGMAAQAMLQRGAHALLATYECAPGAPDEPWLPLRQPDALWAHRQRSMRKQIELGASYDETLAMLGKRTRRNLRYYRRRLQAKLPCGYVADAREQLTEAEMLDLNRSSLYPIRRQLCRLRHRTSCMPDGFMAALRSADGTLLSALGGWRHGSTTIIHWQSNRSGYEQDSLVTVMRSFFLESEVARGATRLVYHDGTAHSMSNSFKEEQVCEFIVRRRSLRGTLLRLVSRLSAWKRGLPGRDNRLAASLRDPHQRWHAVTIAEASWLSHPVRAVTALLHRED